MPPTLTALDVTRDSALAHAVARNAARTAIRDAVLTAVDALGRATAAEFLDDLAAELSGGADDLRDLRTSA